MKLNKREKALLIAVKSPREKWEELEDSLSELKSLAESAGAQVVDQVIQVRKVKDPRFAIGQGKALELKEAYKGHIDMLILDGDLSGSQQKSLEDLLEVKVLDRSALILDIFAQRARTREGMLQVEMAQLEYLLPRLVGRTPFLSRLGGGIGTRGPGETKLEIDRRHLRRRIAQTRMRLERVRRSRETMRRKRQRHDLPLISLVGYTNAGKSTLFNALSRAEVLVEDRMFATLDPTVRRMRLPGGRFVLLSDTVGFIRRLPLQLIHAFRATLEELVDADLLLHVVDASHPRRKEQIQSVEEVLAEIGAMDRSTLLVYNKIDRLDRREEPGSGRMAGEGIYLSALTGEGLDLLRECLQSLLFPDCLTLR